MKQFDAIIIVADLTGINEISYLTNTSMLALDRLPGHLVVVSAVTSAWNSRRPTVSELIPTVLGEFRPV